MSNSQLDRTLSSTDRRELLHLARQSIEAHLQGKKLSLPDPSSPVLKERRGAFVTLHEAGGLRGCIGFMQPLKPLYETISEMAAAAAFDDTRFNPVTASELPRLEIEISVLSVLVKIDDPQKIVMGRHGVLVESRGYSGVFLPQVATETGWSREEFLDNLCLHKAGLPAKTWRDKATNIYVFTAEIFSEKSEGLR